MSLMIRSLLIVVALFVVTTLPAQAEKIALSEMSRYLNGFDTAKGGFTQINGDGTISTGTIFIHRPGRVRFEYDPPDAALVMAGGGQVAVFDPKSNTPPDQYPLARTPLNLILARNVDLGRSGMVVAHGEDGPSTTVTARDPDRPEIGTIKLVFTGNPVELRQWVITDDTGAQTTVILGTLEKGGRLGSSLFNIVQETEKRMR